MTLDLRVRPALDDHVHAMVRMQSATLATTRPMARIDGGELLTRTLARHGVREVFTLHGGHLDAAYQAESARRLRFIDARHEQAAGHAADGWARTTGRVGVA